MKIKVLVILVIVLPVLAFMAVPGARALCTDPPAPGVNYDGCDLTGADFSGENLTGAILTNTILDGTIFSNAILSGADMSSTAPSVYTGTQFDSSQIDGLILGNIGFFLANFTYAEGIPDVSNTLSIFGTCPAPGVFTTPSYPFCSWAPTAVTLADMGAAAVPDTTPLLMTAVLLAVSAGLFLLRRGMRRAGAAP